MSRRPFNGGPGNCPAKRRWQASDAARSAGPSMEGRAIARPNRGVPVELPTFPGPSMEGRAIARPNNRSCEVALGERAPSMEGRAIARPNMIKPGARPCRVNCLQWRAGQLPGQTRWATMNAARLTRRLQWRAGQLPGQTSNGNASAALAASLQWRAGQLPGQTAGYG